ncbi:sporulation-induced protein [Tieghemiomyces parasiticus]|uniref:Sporulation-induced protein n=1 Tax=Tieghemiomyces parasiticus TaxID=78921 RepID=A0A9W8ADV4_9FUNG|nr:sporulation-induced protein [Tieghemiomyces parasiticus]
MFWRFGFQQPSNIRTLLDKQDLTLEELFDQDDLLQEVKGENTRLLDHLAEPAVLYRLIDFVVSPDFEELPSRHTYLACEILSIDKVNFAQAVVERPDFLEHLWSYLARPRPLQFLQASYFSRVMCAFLQKQPTKMLEFIKSQDNVVSRFLTHIETSAITDLLLKLVSLEEIPEGAGIAEWLSTQDLISRLVDLLNPNNDVDTHSMAAQVLLDIIAISQCNNPEQPSIGTNCLVGELKGEAIVSRIIDYMLDPEAPNATSSLVNGVFIFIELIRRNYCDRDIKASPANPSYPQSNMMVPADLSDLIRVVSRRLGQFKDLLLHPRPNAASHAVGVNKCPPLGFERLRVCELFAELLHCSNMYKLNVAPTNGSQETVATECVTSGPAADDAMAVSPPKEADHPMSTDVSPPHPDGAADTATEEDLVIDGADTPVAPPVPTDLGNVPVGQLLKWKLIEHQVVPTCLDLFFQFPWNNFLHSVVFDMLHQILNLPFGLGCNRALVLATFREARLTQRIAEAYRLNQAECEKPKGVRFGYMGHLTGIAEEVVRLCDRSGPAMMEHLRESVEDPAWKDFVQALRENQARDRLPLGGEKPAATDNILAGMQDTSYLEPTNDDMDEDLRNDQDDDDDDEYGDVRGGMGGMGSLGLLGGAGAGIEGDQFVRYLSHQITSELPEHLAGGSSDEDDDDTHDVIDDDEDDAEIGWINEYRKELTFDRNLPAGTGSLLGTGGDAAGALRSGGDIGRPAGAELADADAFTNRRSSLGALDHSSDEDDAPSRANPPASGAAPSADIHQARSLALANSEPAVAPGPGMPGNELLTVADWSADFLQAFETQTDGNSSPFKETITEEGFDFEVDSGRTTAPGELTSTPVLVSPAAALDSGTPAVDLDDEFSDFQQADDCTASPDPPSPSAATTTAEEPVATPPSTDSQPASGIAAEAK